MTTSDTRWPPEAEELVARYQLAFVDVAGTIGPWERLSAKVQEGFREESRALLAALADAGHLRQPVPEDVQKVMDDTVEQHMRTRP